MGKKRSQDATPLRRCDEIERETQINIFIVSLADAVERRRCISAQLQKAGLEAEFFDAVNGKALSEADIATLVDRERCLKTQKRELTRGEIGCALSHLSIYRQMRERGIEKAVVLEDDALLSEDFAVVCGALNQMERGNYVIKLEKPNSSAGAVVPTPWRQRRLRDKYKIVYPLSLTSLTTGYYIDIAACNTICAHCEKVFLLADNWEYWRRFLRLRVLTPPAVFSPNAFTSSIEGERAAHRTQDAWYAAPFKKCGRFLRRLVEGG